MAALPANHISNPFHNHGHHFSHDLQREILVYDNSHSFDIRAIFAPAFDRVICKILS